MALNPIVFTEKVVRSFLRYQLTGLDRATDEAVWNYGRANEFVIVTKDSDFQERSQISGSAPCVV